MSSISKKSPIAILSGKGHTAATLAALANHVDKVPAIKGPIAATPAVAAAITGDNALKFARELGEHYKHRALTAEAKLKAMQAAHDEDMAQLNGQLASLQGQFRALLDKAKELTNAAG